MEKVLRVSIPNWEKFNPRADRGNFHWFRMQNDFFLDQRVFQLDADSKLVFMFLLCEGSRHNGAEFDLAAKYAAGLLSLNLSRFFKAVERLSGIGLVANGTERNETERNGRNARDSETPAPPPAPSLLEIWNDNCGNLPKASVVSGKRLAAWERRWGESPDIDHWVQAVRKLAASDFCSGSGTRGWKASIDFLLKPDTHLKAIEGSYDNGTGPPRPKTREESVSAANQELWEKVQRGEA